MAKQYLIWKDRNCNGINPEWISLTGKEFFEFIHKDENNGRFFIKLPSLGDGDDTIYIETTKEKYKKSENKRKAESKKKKYKNLFQEVSFNISNENDDLCLYESIGLLDESFEEKIENSIMLDNLNKALNNLSFDELEIISLYYFTDGATERSVAQQLGISQPTFNYRKEKVLKKLKDFFYQN